jgi:hypothetical protein
MHLAIGSNSRGAEEDGQKAQEGGCLKKSISYGKRKIETKK